MDLEVEDLPEDDVHHFASGKNVIEDIRVPENKDAFLRSLPKWIEDPSEIPWDYVTSLRSNYEDFYYANGFGALDHLENVYNKKSTTHSRDNYQRGTKNTFNSRSSNRSKSKPHASASGTHKIHKSKSKGKRVSFHDKTEL